MGELGERIAFLRSLTTMTQERFALEVGIDPSTLSKFERGAASVNTVEELRKMAKGWGVSQVQLLDDGGENGVGDRGEFVYKGGMPAVIDGFFDIRMYLLDHGLWEEK